jgi:hypothetical protein
MIFFHREDRTHQDEPRKIFEGFLFTGDVAEVQRVLEGLSQWSVETAKQFQWHVQLLRVPNFRHSALNFAE